MLYNENDYPDPSTFNPERFIKDGQLDQDIRDPTLIAFGFGRRYFRNKFKVFLLIVLIVCETDHNGRLCPGAHIAISTLWLTAASVLSTFNLSKSVDKDGRVIEPSREYHVGLIR